MKTPTKQQQEKIALRVKIRQLFEDGVSKVEISRRLGISYPTVYRWLNRDTILDKNRSGRPTKVTNSVKKIVESTLRDNVGIGTRKIAKCLNAEFAASGSERTISRRTIMRHLKTTDLKQKCSTATKSRNIQNLKVPERANRQTKNDGHN